MKTQKAFLLIVLILSQIAVVYSEPVDESKIREIAGKFVGQSQEIIDSYHAICSGDYYKERRAFDYLIKHDAYEILALALPGINENYRPAVVNGFVALVEKPTLRSNLIIHALESELKRLRNISNGDLTDRHSYLFQKQNLIGILTELTNIKQKNVDVTSSEQIDDFLETIEKSKEN